MKTEEQIKAEFDKVTALDQGGSLGGFFAIGAPFAAQALEWVLNDSTKPVSELLTEPGDLMT